jgi:hypothetical protein
MTDAARIEAVARAIAPDAFRQEGWHGHETISGENALATAERAIAALEAIDGWRPISEAKKDGRPILIKLKNPVPREWDQARIWDGLIFVARHPGLADSGFDVGWNFAAPVGHGGFPDEWIEGWKEIT